MEFLVMAIILSSLTLVPRKQVINVMIDEPHDGASFIYSKRSWYRIGRSMDLIRWMLRALSVSMIVEFLDIIGNFIPQIVFSVTFAVTCTLVFATGIVQLSGRPKFLLTKEVVKAYEKP